MTTQTFTKNLETHGNKKLLDSKDSSTKPSHGRSPPSLYRYLGNLIMNRLMEATKDKERQRQYHLNNQGGNLEENLNEMTPVLRKRYGISEPDDPAEQEATNVASQIVNMEPSADNAQMEVNNGMRVSRSPIITRKQETNQDAHSAVDLDLPTSDGLPLERSVAAYMEPRFGYSFEDVRIHTSSQSAELSHELNARAFATGKDVYFRHGEYNPGTKDGKQLIAHELTHVVQQGQAHEINNTTISRTKKGEPKKTLTLNITTLEGSTRSTDVSDASTILENAANVKIVAGKVESLDKTKSEALIDTDLILDEFTTPGSPTAEETALTVVNRTADTITGYFVKSLSRGSHGENFRPGVFPTIPVSVVIKNDDSPFVAGKPLAHELGHILLEKGTHPSDVTNLMSYSNTGVGLTPDEKTKVRGSSFVK